MKSTIAALLVTLSGSSAFAAQSQVVAIRAKLAQHEKAQFGIAGKNWTVTKLPKLSVGGVHRFTGFRSVDSGPAMGLMTTRSASGNFQVVNGRAKDIKVLVMDTAM